MKLTSEQVQQVLGQLDAEVIPAEHPTSSQLEEAFGAHTFFMETGGLDVVERAAPVDSGNPEGYVVRIAAWADDQRRSLVPQEAEVVATIDLGAA